MPIDPRHDAMGTAIADYFHTGKADKLRVLSPMFDEDEIPVDYLFRPFDAMPPLEQQALQMARGRVLDIGAGAGCHALALQEQGADVTAIDISQASCDVMKARGIRKVACQNVLDKQFCGQYDTILLLMNGIGMAATLAQAPRLIGKLKQLLAPGGQILTDSADIAYVFANEDGSLDIDLNGRYYGEIDYHMEYKHIKGKPFGWLYIDFTLLQSIATSQGLKAELIAEGEENNYLARLTYANQ